MNKQITFYDIVDCFLDRLWDGPDKIPHGQLLRNVFIFMDNNVISDELQDLLTKLMSASCELDRSGMSLNKQWLIEIARQSPKMREMMQERGVL